MPDPLAHFTGIGQQLVGIVVSAGDDSQHGCQRAGRGYPLLISDPPVGIEGSRAQHGGLLIGAGTERGVTEPSATFSACFGAPFMALPPSTYATLLGEKIAKHQVQTWLINTGWSGGAYGQGQRMKLSLTRAMISAILSDTLSGVETRNDTHFGLAVPVACPNVPSEILDPRRTWPDAAAYDRKAAELAGMFVSNFQENAADAPSEIAAAGPMV